ncbi:hypothetical protein FJT64_022284 [Amphibalanus amphitrite]|uniref:Endonuclease/exonuclease/phosphatase domain-containing protein n=1 Tax=Amphibalanus amphitrite TaxID=1232801 RepID=A0A6A4WHG7_AMPAM|nr:hypothetical protein FJT64_022284 [Amphibalanus amphitrite]
MTPTPTLIDFGLKLRPSQLVLTSFTGQQIPLAGEADVSVELRGQQKMLRLVVSKLPPHKPLMGREWIGPLQMGLKSPAQLNIQSYKPKLHDIRNDIHDVYGFDVLALCETWLAPPVPDRLVGVSGYRLFRRDRPVSSSLPRGRGGVAVLVRDSLSCELLPTPVTGVAGSNLEIIWVLVRTSKHQTVLVASAYRVPHNTARQLTTDLDDLECQLQHMTVNFP